MGLNGRKRPIQPVWGDSAQAHSYGWVNELAPAFQDTKTSGI